MTLRFEIVRSIDSYWDQPRSGVADLDGVPHWFVSHFDDADDDYGHCELCRLSAALADQIAEKDSIWRRWRDAHDAGLVGLETHPALPHERPRYDELDQTINAELATLPTFDARATFRCVTPGAVLAQWEVAWEVVR